MAVFRNSRYNFAPIVRVVNATGHLIEREHLDLRPTLVRIAHSDNLEIIPNSGDNWSRLAWRALGDGRLYWIICDYSQIIDPLSELKPATKTKYVSQLLATIPAGAEVAQITVDYPKNIKRAMRLRLEDLDPAHAVSVETHVLDVNETTGVVTCQAFTPPAGGIPFALSRVSRVYEEGVRLTVPSASRALFEALDFNNPLNILVT